MAITGQRPTNPTYRPTDPLLVPVSFWDVDNDAAECLNLYLNGVSRRSIVQVLGYRSRHLEINSLEPAGYNRVFRVADAVIVVLFVTGYLSFFYEVDEGASPTSLHAYRLPCFLRVYASLACPMPAAQCS